MKINIRALWIISSIHRHQVSQYADNVDVFLAQSYLIGNRHHPGNCHHRNHHHHHCLFHLVRLNHKNQVGTLDLRVYDSLILHADYDNDGD